MDSPVENSPPSTPAHLPISLNIIPSMYKLKISSPKEDVSRPAKLQTTPNFRPEEGQAMSDEDDGMTRPAVAPKPLLTFFHSSSKDSPVSSFKEMITKRILSERKSACNFPVPVQAMTDGSVSSPPDSVLLRPAFFPPNAPSPARLPSGSTAASATDSALKRKRVELEDLTAETKFKSDSPEFFMMPKKLFAGQPVCDEPNDFQAPPAEARSPNIRARWLMNDKMFEGKYTCSLAMPQPLESRPSSKHITNPFKDITTLSRMPSDMDLGGPEGGVSRRDSAAGTVSPFDLSRSPLILMRTNSRAAMGTGEDFSRVVEDITAGSMSKAMSTCSVLEDGARFEDEFEVISELGKGHFGVVKKCRSKFDGLEYAVKVTKHKLKGELGKQEALQEVYALSALSVCDDNPYIVKYFTGWIEDSKLYVVVTFL